MGYRDSGLHIVPRANESDIQISGGARKFYLDVIEKKFPLSASRTPHRALIKLCGNIRCGEFHEFSPTRDSAQIPSFAKHFQSRISIDRSRAYRSCAPSVLAREGDSGRKAAESTILLCRSVGTESYGGNSHLVISFAAGQCGIRESREISICLYII